MNILCTEDEALGLSDDEADSSIKEINSPPHIICINKSLKKSLLINNHINREKWKYKVPQMVITPPSAGGRFDNPQ